MSRGIASAPRTAFSSLVVALALSACGGASPNEGQSTQATGAFPATVSAAFPARQRLAEATRLLITVHNSGTRTMPNVAVTLLNPQAGSGAQALGTLLAQPASGQPPLAGRSRPVWIIDQAPGPCGYSCHQGGPGAGATAYTNTWALGPLAPGRSLTFAWHVTAVEPGTYTVAYQVAAGLSGAATATGASTRGRLHIVISSKPRSAYVNNAGQVVSH
ncbi:MAG TPA: hypothetical protein VFN48_08165 [Solirubrobacteraceae bacterium]|nr:hypothetical protein [Solirubrobacteraceae bacterium]